MNLFFGGGGGGLKVLAVKPDDLNSIPGSHMVRVENDENQIPPTVL